MFYPPSFVFGSTVGVGSRFHVLRAQTHFQRYRGPWVPFSYFARPNSFSAVTRVCLPVFMFFAPVPVFGGTEGVGSCFQVLRSRTHFRRYRGRRVPICCFACMESFSAVPRASGPVSVFCAPELVFDGSKGVGSVFMFCAPGLVFGATEGVVSRFHILFSRTHFRRCRVRPSCFHVLCSQTHIRRYRGRRVPFSCFLCSDSFSAIPRASLSVFMFSDPGHIFGGTEGVESCFQVLRSRTRFRWYRGRRVLFSRFALPDNFLAVRRYRVPFSRFALPDSFSAVPGALGPIFLFCAPGLIFDGTEGVGSHFHVLCSRTRFRRNRGRPFPFSCFALWD
jgi:hypothetical protein